jgi:Zn-dependent peptidase ImmA (M78 family)
MRLPGHPAHIFFNDSHAATRQASDITHECAHDILGHELGEAFDGLGCRHWNAEQEAEVDYLAPALLVTRDGALWALRRGMTEAEAAAHFGVSVVLFRMRANMTGANRQLVSERRRYPRRATGA